jgi:hypothetical protein
VTIETLTLTKPPVVTTGMLIRRPAHEVYATYVVITESGLAGTGDEVSTTRLCVVCAEVTAMSGAGIMLMVDDAGAIQTVSVTPASLQTCIEPIVRPRTLPRTRRGSEVMVHTVRR